MPSRPFVQMSTRIMGKVSPDAKFLEMAAVSCAFSQILLDVLCREKPVCKANQPTRSVPWFMSTSIVYADGSQRSRMSGGEILTDPFRLNSVTELGTVCMHNRCLDPAT